MKLEDPEYGPIIPDGVTIANLYFLGRYELYKLEIINTGLFKTKKEESPILRELQRLNNAKST